ncbi:MAG: hypothetical protein ACJ8A6_13140 [Gemmatimonadales bacterium]
MRALFLLLVIAAGLLGASFAGARFAAGKVVGPNPQGMGPPASRLAYQGISALRAKPRGWIISYPQATEFGPNGAAIYVSLNGALLGTRPANLAQLMEARRNSNEP